MKQGAVLEQLHAGLSKVGIFQSASREDLVVDGTVYHRLVPPPGSAEPFTEVIEVSWTDVQRPNLTILGALRHAFYLILAFLRLCTLNWTDQSQRPIAGSYKIAFEVAFVWCIFPPITIMLLWTSENHQVLIAGCAVAVVVAITLFLQRFSLWFWAGLGWAAGIAVVSYVFIDGSEPSLGSLRWTTWTYVGCQIAVLVIAPFAVVEIVGLWQKNRTLPHILARLSFLYGPAFAVSALGALLWVGALEVTNQANGDLSDWAGKYVDAVPYNLAAVEYVVAFTVAFPAFVGLAGVGFYMLWRIRGGSFDPLLFVPISAILIVTPLAPAAAFAYFFRSVDAGTAVAYGVPALILVAVAFLVETLRQSNRNAGDFARGWFLFVLLLWPALIVLAVVAIVMDWRIDDFATPRNKEEPLSIYQVSLSRALPYLVFLAGPLVIALDAAGDVLFYLLRGSKLSTDEKTRSRLETAIKHASGDEIVLMAHSQGSIIAEDVIASKRATKPVHLITFGSPISTLHKRFLESTAENRTGVATAEKPKMWTNICRKGDFIGGWVDRQANHWSGSGGHTGYWSDLDFLKLAKTAWEGSAPSRPKTKPAPFLGLRLCLEKLCAGGPSRRGSPPFGLALR